MKKTICLVLLIIICFSSICLISACDKESKEKITNTCETTLSEAENINISGNNKTKNDIGGGSLSLTKYRIIYCDIPRPFANLVDLYEFEDWYEDIIENDPNKTDIMPMKLFIQEFDISREDFDRANLELAKIIIKGFKGKPLMNPQDFANQETDEVYNADIIYTFDDEIINNYYLSHEYPFVYITDYENAVANGTYKTRTTEFIDIEQMEAEIIAKYGKAEIVTEITLPNEPTTAISDEITSTEKSTTETTE